MEAFVEIHAMARCSLLVHGFSAMLEAVFYTNIDLHNWSVNLDDNGQNVLLDDF